MTTSQVLQHLYSLDASSPDLLRSLHCLIRKDEDDHHLSTLQESDLTQLVDFLDRILDTVPVADDVFRRCLHKLRAICSHHGILPSSYTISGDIARVGENPVAFGGFSDVWKGAHNGSEVCIKHLRIAQRDREATEKAFYKEAIMWKRLRHPNIVAFIGVTRGPLQFVSEWMPNGTLTDYANQNPGANRVNLLLDVAEGLSYLHANHTTHGDLKGPNILVDCTGHARLIDFGFASVVRGLTSILVTKVQGYSERWAAPEVLETGDRNTQEADVFAFGMVVVEIFTGKPPFSKFPATLSVSKIIDGERPDRPEDSDLTELLWEMTRYCWCHNPAQRPTMTKVVGVLRECYTPYAADLDPSSIDAPQPAKKAVKTKNIDSITMPLGFPNAYQRINKIAEKLASTKEGPKGKRYNELLELCTRWNAVPALYELEGVVRQGDQAKRVSLMTEIWKGTYDGEVVALKVLRLSRDDPDIQVAQKRFCTAALLMKRLEHDNILPFYGVSSTVSDFSLVFPWYKNGNTEQYLEKNPGINRYELALGAVKGLAFLHSNGVVHGALRPSHILIDEDGNARLTAAAHNNTSSTRNQSTPLFPEDVSYMAPETRKSSTMTMESDVYEMAIVVYELLTGVAPHHEYRDKNSSSAKVGGTPARAHGLVDDMVWKLLEKCWSGTPLERPSIVEVYRTLKSRPKVTHTPWRRSVSEELPKALMLHVHSIKPPESWPSELQIFSRFKYGSEVHATSPTDRTPERPGGSEYTWNTSQRWVIDTDKQHSRRVISLEVLVCMTTLKPISTTTAREDGIYARGNFSLVNCANKQIVVVLRQSKAAKAAFHVKMSTIAM